MRASPGIAGASLVEPGNPAYGCAFPERSEGVQCSSTALHLPLPSLRPALTHAPNQQRSSVANARLRLDRRSKDGSVGVLPRVRTIGAAGIGPSYIGSAAGRAWARARQLSAWARDPVPYLSHVWRKPLMRKGVVNPAEIQRCDRGAIEGRSAAEAFGLGTPPGGAFGVPSSAVTPKTGALSQ
jgi:hypothetical protein